MVDLDEIKGLLNAGDRLCGMAADMICASIHNATERAERLDKAIGYYRDACHALVGTNPKRASLVRSEDSVWVVVDPRPLSVLADILFKTDLDELAYYMAGSMHSSGGVDWSPGAVHLAIYAADSESDARLDALRRLAVRDGGA